MKKLLLGLVGAFALSGCDSEADEKSYGSCPLNQEDAFCSESLNAPRYKITDSSIVVRHFGHTYTLNPKGFYDNDGNGELDDEEIEIVNSVIRGIRSKN